jgi:hypothetical protein
MHPHWPHQIDEITHYAVTTKAGKYVGMVSLHEAALIRITARIGEYSLPPKILQIRFNCYTKRIFISAFVDFENDTKMSVPI